MEKPHQIQVQLIEVLEKKQRTYVGVLVILKQNYLNKDLLKALILEIRIDNLESFNKFFCL